MMPFRLSGGEQQRVSISAGALLNHPELILADEPQEPDPETSNDIMDLLLSVSKQNNCGALMATHDYEVMSFLSSCCKVRCEDGKLFEVTEYYNKNLYTI